MLCMRTRLQPKRKEPRNLKADTTEQQYNSGHGVCEYMGATHSSQHTAPDAKHSSTHCCPTHEMWELPTPLIVANRSQQGDEVWELPAQPQQHPAIRWDPLALPSGPITRGRSKKFKEALHRLVLSTQGMFKEEGNPAHEKLVGGLRDYIVNIIHVQD
ncbi:protein ECERIFERUM 1-like [Dorcoceras hygrometricum]|uniref:Protein ECERIFERUM 1-like n=1 Tax=Dorcoceras hygrometricum TaxID=472368 RepID=A0A2Z7AH71_9LAMI|nr:protein ECERIFERUM 1-like [Dorcoceras hygrometricum]